MSARRGGGRRPAPSLAPRAPRGVSVADLPPGAQRLLALSGNEAARAAVERVHPFVERAGPDGPAVAERMKRSSNGRKAARSGSRSELIVIGAYHKAALLRGVARLMKLPTPYRRVGSANLSHLPGAFVAVHSERSTVDCWGCTLRGPTRAIFEEVKGVTEVESSGRFAAFAVSRVKPHQREELAAADLAGHVAVVTLVFGEGAAAEVYVVPWAWLASRSQTRREEVLAAGFRVTPATYLDAQVPAAAPTEGRR